MTQRFADPTTAKVGDEVLLSHYNHNIRFPGSRITVARILEADESHIKISCDEKGRVRLLRSRPVVRGRFGVLARVLKPTPQALAQYENCQRCCLAKRVTDSMETMARVMGSMETVSPEQLKQIRALKRLMRKHYKVIVKD